MECSVLSMKKMDFSRENQGLGIMESCKYLETEMKTLLLWVVTRWDRHRFVS